MPEQVDLDELEKRIRGGLCGAGRRETIALIAELRTLRAENERLRNDLDETNEELKVRINMYDDEREISAALRAKPGETK